MSRRNGSDTSERRSPRPHHPHFQGPHLVPCPPALDRTSPSARTLKAIRGSWGNSTACDECVGLNLCFAWYVDRLCDDVFRPWGCSISFHPVWWAQIVVQVSRVDLLFVSCVVAERSPASTQQTQHPALVDRNYRKCWCFVFLTLQL